MQRNISSRCPFTTFLKGYDMKRMMRIRPVLYVIVCSMLLSRGAAHGAGYHVQRGFFSSGGGRFTATEYKLSAALGYFAATISSKSTNYRIVAGASLPYGVSYTLTASTGPGGSMSPIGAVTVVSGGERTFVIIPAEGYHIADVRVDGVSQGALENYVFQVVTAARSIEAFFAPNTVTLNVNFAGTGTGSVLSTPSGIACNTTCSAQFETGTQVILHQKPEAYSLFSGWSDACAGNSDCTVVMDGNKTVTAAFDKDTAHSVWVDGANQAYYPSILRAYFSATTGNIVKAWGTDFTEDVNLNQNKALIFKGGYDSGYALESGMTILKGTLTITNGSLTVDNLQIR